MTPLLDDDTLMLGTLALTLIVTALLSHLQRNERRDIWLITAMAALTTAATGWSLTV